MRLLKLSLQNLRNARNTVRTETHRFSRMIVVSVLLVLGNLLFLPNVRAVDDGNIPTSELQALYSLYNATQGFNWDWRNLSSNHIPWNFIGDPNPCKDNWQGVDCIQIGKPPHESYLVRSINLNERNLVGTLPNALQNLTYLQDLVLIGNHINGTIPPAVTYYFNISRLDLSSNNLEGILPNSLYGMVSIRKLLLGSNKLTGTLSESFGQLINLESIGFSDNTFSGTIPESLGNLNQLRSLNLAFNPFITGTIPASLGGLRVEQMLFTEMALYGTIPAEFGNLSHCINLYLDANQLTGTLPAELGNLKNIVYIDLDRNLFTGTLPDSFAALTTLRYFSVSANMLRGTIPDYIGDFLDLQIIYLDKNEFTGPVPLSLTQYNDIHLLYMSSNYLTGTLPDFFHTMPTLKSLYMQSNFFTGTIPRSLNTLALLSELLLQENLLRGTMEGVFNASQQAQLSLINLSDNELTGFIPDEIYHLPKLGQFLAVSNCLQSKQLGDVVCRSPTLSTLALDGLHTSKACQLAVLPGLPDIHSYRASSSSQLGTLPPCLFEMENLGTLHLSGCGLRGTIPDVVLSSRLVDISLSHNMLTGEIPKNMQLRNWYNLDLSYNRLTGILSEDFGQNLTFINSVNDSFDVSVGRGAVQIPRSQQALALENNRLSGGVPDTLQRWENISVLQGNLFGCRASKQSLPQHDADKEQYQCGSNNFELSLILWGTLAGVALLGATILAIYCLRHPTTYSAIKEGLHLNILDFLTNRSRTGVSSSSVVEASASVQQLRSAIAAAAANSDNNDAANDASNNHIDYNDQVRLNNDSAGVSEIDISSPPLQLPPLVSPEHTRLVFHGSEGLCRVAVTCMTFIVIVFVPLYAILNAYYGTHTKLYAWNIAAGFNTGAVPTITELIALVGFLVLILLIFKRGLNALVFHKDIRRASRRSATVRNSKTNKATPARAAAGNDGMQTAASRGINMKREAPSSSTYVTMPLHKRTVGEFLKGMEEGLHKEKEEQEEEESQLQQESGEKKKKKEKQDAPLNENSEDSGFNNHLQTDNLELFWNDSFVRRFLWYGLFVSINFFVSMMVNSGFVVVALYGTTAEVVLAQIALSIFKLGWGSSISPHIMRWTIQRLASQEDKNVISDVKSGVFFLQLVVALGQTIVIPCMVVAVIDPNCFYNVFEQANEVKALYHYQTCAVFDFKECIVYQPNIGVTSYEPPFVYSYQCSSSLVTYYAPAFIYMAVAIAFVVPVLQMTAMWTLGITTPGKPVHSFVTAIVPPLLKSIDHQFSSPTTPIHSTSNTTISTSILSQHSARSTFSNGATLSSSSSSARSSSHANVRVVEKRNFMRPYFDADRMMLTQLTYFAVLLTFGVVFPPVAVGMAVAIYSSSLFMRYKVSRLLRAAYQQRRFHYIAIIEDESLEMGTSLALTSAMWLLVVLCASFYALFLFDTLGDAEGLYQSWWVLLVVPIAIPFLLYVTYNTVLSLRREHTGGSGSGGGMDVVGSDGLRETMSATAAYISDSWKRKDRGEQRNVFELRSISTAAEPRSSTAAAGSGVPFTNGSTNDVVSALHKPTG